MKEQLTLVTRKGQVTMPAEIRQALSRKGGDTVVWLLEENPVQLRRGSSVVARTAALRKGEAPRLTAEEARAAAARFGRSLSRYPRFLAALTRRPSSSLAQSDGLWETVYTLQRFYQQPKAALRAALLPGIVLPGKRRFRATFDLYVNLNLPLADYGQSTAVLVGG